jgi:hypothetical protein
MELLLPFTMLHTFSASNDFLSPFPFQFRVLATSVVIRAFRIRLFTNFQNIYFYWVKIVAIASFSLFEHSISLNIFRKQIRTNLYQCASNDFLSPFPFQFRVLATSVVIRAFRIRLPQSLTLSPPILPK